VEALQYRTTIQSGIPVADRTVDALHRWSGQPAFQASAGGDADAALNFTAPRRRSPSSQKRFGEIAATRRYSSPGRHGHERNKLWEARHHAALSNLRCGRAPQWSRPMFACRFRGWRNALPKRNATLRKAASCADVGHVGDGNFIHVSST
jgi:hypothetical protein